MQQEAWDRTEIQGQLTDEEHKILLEW